jgi:WD40 repeat protein/TPR repeat protein
LLRLFEAQDNLNGAIFSSDGKLVLTASDDDTAALWEAGTGRQLQLFRGGDEHGRRGLARVMDTGDFSYTDGVNTAVFSPDGKLILTASGVGSVRIFDPATGATVRELLGHTGAVKTARFSPDGGRVVTASSDGTARIWDANTGELLYVLEGHKDSLSDAIFSPDGKLVLTGSNDNTARVWNAETGRFVQVLRGLADADKWYFVSSIAFSPDGESILAGAREGWDGRVRIWKKRALQSTVILRGHEGAVNFGAFSPDGKVVVTASDDKTARLWDAASGEALHIMEGHEDSVIRAQFDPAGKRILTSSGDTTARLWMAATGVQLRALTGHSRPVNAADFSPDGITVVTASSDNTARLWSADSGEMLHVLKGHEKDVTTTEQGQMTIALNELGKRMTGNDNFEKSAEESEGQLTTAAFSPDGTRLVTASTDGTARLWDSATGKTLAVLRGHDAWVVSAAFSRDGKLLVTTSSEPEIVARGNVTARIWDAYTGQQLHVLRGHQGNVNAAVFSPDGKLVLTASKDGTARLWSAGTGELLQVLEGHEGILTAVAFSPDGTRMLTAGGDGTARIWDTATGELLRILAEHEDAIISASFSPDGKYVLTTSNDGTARLWDAPPPLNVLIAYLRASIAQRISAEDRKRLGLEDQAAPPSSGTAGTARERCNALAGNPSDPKAKGPGTALRLIDYFAAIPSCEEAVAEHPGDAQLLYQLGRAFERGYSEESNLRTKRAEIFERGFETNYRAAAELGYPQALYVMSNLEKSPEQALTLLEKAHEGGVIEAAGQISDRYAIGKGSPRDYQKARRWLEIGADEGDPLANNQLGLLYWEGSNEFGIERDWNRALLHFSLAARLFNGSNYDNTLGETRAMLYRANLARQLPMEKVAEIWERAQAWKPGDTPPTLPENKIPISAISSQQGHLGTVPH